MMTAKITRYDADDEEITLEVEFNIRGRNIPERPFAPAEHAEMEIEASIRTDTGAEFGLTMADLTPDERVGLREVAESYRQSDADDAEESRAYAAQLDAAW